MTDPTKEELDAHEVIAREHEAKGMAGVMVSPALLLSLIVAARELESVNSAPRFGQVTVLPDGSGYFTASFPLPKDHWLYEDCENNPPMPFQRGTDDPTREVWRRNIVNAGRYAVRCATMNGREKDWDPDALVQNLVVGMLGYFTPDGSSGLYDWPLPSAPEQTKETP